MNYHAHIYFDLQDLATAQDLILTLKSMPKLQVYGLVPRKVGPHAKPMIEAHFHSRDKEEVIEWFQGNRKNFSILIHQDTGDDYRDHAPENVIWIGEELKIDFKFFDLVKRNPGKSIH